MSTTRAPRETDLLEYTMETITRDDAVQDMDTSDVPAVPSPSVTGVIAPVDVEDHQSVSPLVDSLEHKLATASTFEEAKDVRDRGSGARSTR